MSFQIHNRALFVLIVLCGLAGDRIAFAQDTEPNDTLATAQVVVGDASGATTVASELRFIEFDPLIFDSETPATLAPGAVNTHDFTGLPSGAAYAAYIDNTIGSGAPDTVLHSLDELGNEVAFNDDGSPLGDGFGSGVLSTINGDGSLHFEVTGYADYDFDGIDDDTLDPHTQSGDYSLVLKVGPFGDVDYFRVTGLLPGSSWTAETVEVPGETPPDTVLSLYDEAGGLLDQNDDIDFPDNLLSALGGTVPASGEIILAATAFPDYTNVGAHLDFGLYGLALTYTAVPEPATWALGALGACACLALRRRS